MLNLIGADGKKSVHTAEMEQLEALKGDSIARETGSVPQTFNRIKSIKYHDGLFEFELKPDPMDLRDHMVMTYAGHEGVVVPENERLSSRKPFGPVRRAFQGEVAKDVHLVVLRYGPFPVFLQQEIHLVHRYEFPVRKDGVVIEMTTTNHEFHAVSFFIRSLTESSSRHAR